MTASKLEAFIAQPEPALISQPQLEAMLGRLSIALPKAAMSDVEASERASIYWQALRTQPIDDMRSAFSHLLMTCKFFPTIAEIMDAASIARGQRLARKHRAMQLIHEHRKQQEAQNEPDADEQAQIAKLVRELKKSIDMRIKEDEALDTISR